MSIPILRVFGILCVSVSIACKESAAPPEPGPLVFSTLTSGGIALDAHSCGITDAGKTYCWGAGGYGRLGGGTATSSSVPSQVSSGQLFARLSAGGYHTCALTSGGEAWCWGRNNSGQLGDGATTDAMTPVRVSGAVTFVNIDAGAYHTCAVTAAGVAYCWGANSDGQLGDGSNTQRLTPTPVSGALTFTAISAGGNTEQSHTCARTSAGAVYCWGQNGFGQLGRAGSSSTMPVQISGTLAFESVAAGGYHTCGRTSAASYCWGYNAYGQLGSSAGNSSIPVQVPALSLAFVNAGGWTTCGVGQNSNGYCWGWGHYGERGDGVTSDVQSAPTPILGDLAFASVTPGPYHACGLTTAGKAYCWGYNADGQLGDGSTLNKSSPSPVRDP